MSEISMRVLPEEMRGVASELGHLGGDADQVRGQLQGSWNRLDAGWQSYAKGNVEERYHQAMEELRRMAAMLEQMGRAVHQTADRIEEADQASVGFFADVGAGEKAGSRPPGLASYASHGPTSSAPAGGGITADQEEAAMAIIDELADEYGVNVEVDFGWKRGQWESGEWTLEELEILRTGVVDLATEMGGPEAFRQNLGGVDVSQGDTGGARGLASAHKITFTSGASSIDEWTVVHELAHAWDANNGWQLSKDMQQEMGAGFPLPLINPILRWIDPDNPDYWYMPGSGPPPCGVDVNFNAKEDFAEAVTAFVYSTEAGNRADGRGWPYDDPARGYSYADFDDTPRGQFIQDLMEP